MSDPDAGAPPASGFGDVASRSQEAGIADESAAYAAHGAAEATPIREGADARHAVDGSGSNGTDQGEPSGAPSQMSDAEVIALAAAERDAGVPDLQTAKAAAAAKGRMQDESDYGAHPS